jgi:hypothetical protein
MVAECPKALLLCAWRIQPYYLRLGLSIRAVLYYHTQGGQTLQMPGLEFYGSQHFGKILMEFLTLLKQTNL